MCRQLSPTYRPNPRDVIQQDIPKRRRGPQELDLVMLNYLDETVRREARIALAVEGVWCGGWGWSNRSDYDFCGVINLTS